MEGDFTRNSDDRQGSYSGVLMQQGRVQLDSDWNEQWLIQTRALREALRDLIGRHGGPTNNLGFGIGPQTGDSQTLAVSTGVYYVDGIRCEQRNPDTTLSLARRDPANYLVFLDVWERHVNAIEDPHIREVALLGPDSATRAEVLWRLRLLSFSNEFPSEESAFTLADTLVDERLRQRRRRRLAAQANTTSANTDPCMLSPLSQYRGRENQLYRVQIHDAWPGSSGGKPGGVKPGGVKPGGVKPGAKEPGRARGREKNPVEKTPVDKADTGGDPVLFTFKWSRDNGSVVFPIVPPVHVGSPESSSTAGDSEIVVTVQVGHLGRDERYGLVANDIVEFVHDAVTRETIDDAVLAAEGRDPGRPGLLGRVLSPIDPDDLTVRIAVYADDIAEIAEDTLHPYLRRWDQRDTAERKLSLGAIAVRRSELDSWLPLEDGVEVLFEGPKQEPLPPEGEDREIEQRSGDYWMIPARTATGDVVWPTVQTGTSQAVRPARLAPHGPDHHYAPLALLTLTATGVSLGLIRVRKQFGPFAFNEPKEP